MAAARTSPTPRTVEVHKGEIKAAASRPTTTAFMPFKAARTPRLRRNVLQ